MHVLLVTNGSHGDIHPFIAIGLALKARGCDSTVVTNPYFQSLIEHVGLKFEALGEHMDVGEYMKTSDAMHKPYRAAKHVFTDFVVPHATRICALTRDMIASTGAGAVLVHPLCIGANWACEMTGTPWCGVGLPPMTWMTRHDPWISVPHMPGWPTPSLHFVRLASWIAGRMMRGILDKPLNRQRAALGLPPITGHYQHVVAAGAINFGLWSSVIRPPQPDDPPTARTVGFPWFDTHDPSPDDARLEQFLADGPAPIVFARGSAYVHRPGRFFEIAAAACKALNRRGVLLIGRKGEPLRDLPNGVITIGYAPFSTLFPYAAVNVHHGGIGSTGQGLRAGRPTVIVPSAFDQFDNAARCERIGCSQTVFVSRLSEKRLTAALDRVVNDLSFARRAAEVAPLAQADGGAATADAVIALIAAGAARPIPLRR